MQDRKKLEIRKIIEERKLVGELSKLAIIAGSVILFGICSWRLL
jgi:hypothetical protein